MIKEQYSLKDFNLTTLPTDATDRSESFRKYIAQLTENDHRIFWIEADTPLKTKMGIKHAVTNEQSTVISFVSNDYLGMSQREETINAAIDGLRKYGTGVCAAPIIGGYLDIHRQLEQEIAEFVGMEDALIFSSGFGANAGVLNALLGSEDLALVDTYVHTSVLDGLRSTNVKKIGHNDLEYIELVLKREQDNYKTKMVIIDGVYSQDGDVVDIPGIKKLCDQYGALLFVDDAHGIGVFGENGRGVLEHFGMLGQVDFVSGTFSKSFGAVGGFVAASKDMVQYLRYYANTTVFSASIVPPVVCSILKALELIKARPELRKKLWDNVSYLRNRLQEEGFDIGKSVSPIFPVMIRDDFRVKEITRDLMKEGIYALGIVYPAVRAKDSRLRISVLATHEIEQLERLVVILSKIFKKN